MYNQSEGIPDPSLPYKRLAPGHSMCLVQSLSYLTKSGSEILHLTEEMGSELDDFHLLVNARL